MSEIWIICNGLNSNYSVSNLGNIKHNKSGRIKMPTLHYTSKKSKYRHMIVNLGGKTYSLSRIVAQFHLFDGHILINDKTLEVDHIDNNTSNNNANNLMFLKKKDNLKKRKFKGVCYNKRTSKWEAQLKIDGKHILHKLYATENEAINAYQKASIDTLGFNSPWFQKIKPIIIKKYNQINDENNS